MARQGGAPRASCELAGAPSFRVNRPMSRLAQVCIHQSRIGDGLKALPVNVMACNQMLVLCGPTYPRRLWCVWELFTLLSFSTLEHAQERITLAAFAGDGGLGGKHKDGLDDLVAFDVASAHCYDPNEEARLRSIINVSSEYVFNSRIQKLAGACRTAQEKWGYIDLGMGIMDIKGLVPGTRKAKTELHDEIDALREHMGTLEDELSGTQKENLALHDELNALRDRIWAHENAISSRMSELEALLDNARENEVSELSRMRPTAADADGSIDERCATLTRLLDKGHISEEEYKEAKRQMLVSFGL